MRILIILGFMLSLLATPLLAWAIQTLELKELPPLQSLHYCQDSNGVVNSQNEACESNKTEVSSISAIRNGKVIHAPLGATLDTWNPDAEPGASIDSVDSSAATLNELPKTTGNNALSNGGASNEEMEKGGFLTIGFGIVFGMIWKQRKKSFLLGFAIGVAVRLLLATFVMRY